MTVTRIGPGAYRIEHDGKSDIVYVAAHGAARWVFWNGRVYRADEPSAPRVRRHAARTDTAETLEAPMPARVIRILVTEGAAVKKGETVVVLEAMKMELPIRAPADLTVASIACREGELVQANQPLVELR